MTGRDIECVVWCPECGTDKYRVIRKPTGQNGVYEHEMEAIGQGLKDRKTCADCSTEETLAYLCRKED